MKIFMFPTAYFSHLTRQFLYFSKKTENDTERRTDDFSFLELEREWVFFSQYFCNSVFGQNFNRFILDFSQAHKTFYLRKKYIFSPPTFMKIRFSSLNSKIGQTISLNFFNRAFYLPRAVLKAVLLQ